MDCGATVIVVLWDNDEVGYISRLLGWLFALVYMCKFFFGIPRPVHTNQHHNEGGMLSKIKFSLSKIDYWNYYGNICWLSKSQYVVVLLYR